MLVQNLSKRGGPGKLKFYWEDTIHQVVEWKGEASIKFSQRMVWGVTVLFTEIFFYPVMICLLKYDRTRSVKKQNKFSRDADRPRHHLTQAQKTVLMMSQMGY